MVYQPISKVGIEGCSLEKWLGRALSGCSVLIDVSSYLQQLHLGIPAECNICGAGIVDLSSLLCRVSPLREKG
jgi:hypothetical protein